MGHVVRRTEWHLGFRTRENLPTGRGFDTYLGLLGGGSDHFDKTLCVGPHGGLGSLCPCANTAATYPFRVDYTDGDKPAKSLWDNTTYDAYQFSARAVQLVEAHDVTTPFFLYWAPHKVHAPLQVAAEFLTPYPLDDNRQCRSTPETCDERGWTDCGCTFMCSCNRRMIKGMVTAVDAMLTNLTVAMQAKGMWQNTLVFFLGDNGA